MLRLIFIHVHASTVWTSANTAEYNATMLLMSTPTPPGCSERLPRETRRIKEEVKQISVTKKVAMVSTIYDLVEQCDNMLERYKTHVFNINHQYQFYRSLQLKMGQTECLIHVDFFPKTTRANWPMKFKICTLGPRKSRSLCTQVLCTLAPAISRSWSARYQITANMDRLGYGRIFDLSLTT